MSYIPGCDIRISVLMKHHKPACIMTYKSVNFSNMNGFENPV